MFTVMHAVHYQRDNPKDHKIKTACAPSFVSFFLTGAKDSKRTFVVEEVMVIVAYFRQHTAITQPTEIQAITVFTTFFPISSKYITTMKCNK